MRGSRSSVCLTGLKAVQVVGGDDTSLAATKAELHKSCDFLMKNFDLRQGAITAEIEGRLTFRSSFFLTS